MSDEALLIFKMVQEGKITPEQGVSLLEAITKAQNSSSNGSSSQSAPSGDSWGSLSNVQRRLAEMQQRLGEMQAKIGAAQAGSSSSASNNSGSVKLPFGLGDFNVTEIIDEAVKGMNQIKAEATVSAKRAARQAQKEARRFRSEAERLGKTIRVEVNVGFESSGRPRNTMGLPEVTIQDERTFGLADDGVINFRNSFGDIKITGNSPDDSIHVYIEKTVWGATRADSEERLGHIELSESATPMGQEITVKHTSDEGDDAVVTMSVQVPSRARVGAHTGFGDIRCESLTGGIGKIQSTTGDVRIQDIDFASVNGHTPLIETRSGVVSINKWRTGLLEIESLSGGIELQDSEPSSIIIRTTSGDLTLRNAKTSAQISAESISGDLFLRDATATAEVIVKTQSGDINLESVAGRQLSAESASGDIEATNLQSVDGLANITSISGDVQVKSLAAQTFQISTTSGDANIELADGASGQGSLITVSGDLELSLASNYQAQVTMSTHSGTIRCGFPLVRQEGDGRQYLAGRIGDSSTTAIRLQSVSGDLSILKHG